MRFDNNRFVELLKPEYNDALRYCRSLCSKRSAEDANDIIQQSLLKALENIEGLESEEKFRPWLFSIITREFYNFVRKDFWRKFIPSDDESRRSSLPELVTASNEEYFKDDIAKALNCLSSKERSAILLFETGGFSIEEIKEIQNERSLSTVKSRLSRARAKLRSFFENESSIPASSKSNEYPEGELTDETYRLIQEARGKF